MSRLIDADALKEKVFLTYQNNGVEIEEIMVVPVGAIDNAPTVEPKHGEWIDTGYGIRRCSVCGEKCQTYCMDKPRDRYCLWCGVRMKEGDEK